MRTYNRALDFTVLALAELKKGNGPLAARLMAKAVEQKDITAAIRILEASNKQAFAVKASAKARLKANEEFPFEGGEEVESDAAEDFNEDEFGGDPLEEVEGEADDMDMEEYEEEPGMAMAKVLSKMVRKTRR